MIDSDKEFGALVKQYEENRRHIEDIKKRLASDAENVFTLWDALTHLHKNNIQTFQLVDDHFVVNPRHHHTRKEIPVSSLDLNSILERLIEYLRAMKTKQTIEGQMRNAGLEGLIKT